MAEPGLRNEAGTVINWKPLVAAGAVLGIGMGGFFDGIVAHQIFQLHSMLSNRLFPDTLVNAEINMFWDGLFHALTWVTNLVGLVMLWRAIKRPDVPLSGKALIYSMLFGWGLFNFVEGVIDHHILQLHHVVQRAAGPAQLMYDLAFLASGLVLMGIGWVGIRGCQKAGGARFERTRPLSRLTPHQQI